MKVLFLGEATEKWWMRLFGEARANGGGVENNKLGWSQANSDWRRTLPGKTDQVHWLLLIIILLFFFHVIIFHCLLGRIGLVMVASLYFFGFIRGQSNRALIVYFIFENLLVSWNFSLKIFSWFNPPTFKPKYKEKWIGFLHSFWVFGPRSFSFKAPFHYILCFSLFYTWVFQSGSLFWIPHFRFLL